MKPKTKHKKKERNNFSLKKALIILLFIILLCCLLYIAYYLYSSHKDKQENTNILGNIKVDNEEITDTKTERMLQLEELQKQNNEIIGWLEIEDTKINYPVCKTNDNDFYLTHNYKKEKSSLGSIFLDKNFDLKNGSSNYLIYGHRSEKGLMFEDLIKYAKKEFYNSHKTIKFTTNNKDSTYEILAIFYSRVYYKSEQNVFRYYFFVNADNEQAYNDYVSNCKKASIYDTNVNAKYGDQLLTLSTCEYSQEDGRFVVVAKEMK